MKTRTQKIVPPTKYLLDSIFYSHKTLNPEFQCRRVSLSIFSPHHVNRSPQKNQFHPLKARFPRRLNLCLHRHRRQPLPATLRCRQFQNLPLQPWPLEFPRLFMSPRGIRRGRFPLRRRVQRKRRRRPRDREARNFAGYCLRFGQERHHQALPHSGPLCFLEFSRRCII